MTQTHRTTIDLDAVHLDALCDFYGDLLGYRVACVEHRGQITEVRTLESEAYPGLRLRFHNCSPRPPVASALGTIRALEFEVDDPVAAAARVKDPKWIRPPGDDKPEAADRLILRDSTGYHVALVRRRADCACDGATPA